MSFNLPKQLGQIVAMLVLQPGIPGRTGKVIARFFPTLFGRRRAVPELRSSNYRDRSLGERLAVNTILQGTAADIVKLAMVKLSARLSAEGLAARILLQVHDEIILETLEEEVERTSAVVREVMEGAGPQGVPLRVQCEAGDSWGAFH